MYCNPTISNDAKSRISLHTSPFFVILYRYLALPTDMRSLAQKYKNCRLSAGCSHNNKYGGLTEWLRSSPGKRVRCNSPVGSSPMSSARIQRPVSGLFFIEIYWNFMGKKWLFLMVRHTGNHEFPDYEKKQPWFGFFTAYELYLRSWIPIFQNKTAGWELFHEIFTAQRKTVPR